MAIDEFLLIGIVKTIVSAFTDEDTDGEFSIPTRAVPIVYQINLDTTPATLDLVIELSIDGVVWAAASPPIDETSFTNDTLIGSLIGYAARYIRLNVTANPDEAEVTVLVLPKYK